MAPTCWKFSICEGDPVNVDDTSGHTLKGVLGGIAGAVVGAVKGPAVGFDFGGLPAAVVGLIPGPILGGVAWAQVGNSNDDDGIDKTVGATVGVTVIGVITVVAIIILL